MAGVLTFDLKYITQNANLLPEMSERCKNLTPFFDNVINEWAKDNRDKFDLSVGGEAGGVAEDVDVFWKGLTPRYMARKRKEGMSDHLMVATGELERAMTDPEGFFRAVTLEEAVFGTPKSAEDEDKVRYNWQTRQVIFLSNDDQKMIEKEIQDYLSLGGNYRDIQFAAGLQNARDRNDDAQMTMEFNDTVGS